MGLIIFLTYYFLLSSAFTLTKDAATSPWLTFWASHTALAILGAYFLRQSAREKPTAIVVWFDQAIRTLQKRAKKNVDS